MPISQTFLYLQYQKINNSVLKFDHFLLRMPKIIYKLVKSFLPKNAIEKHDQPADK